MTAKEVDLVGEGDNGRANDEEGGQGDLYLVNNTHF